MLLASPAVHGKDSQRAAVAESPVAFECKVSDIRPPSRAQTAKEG